MQNAKDTFYEALRGRLAGANPERTIVVRGITRPGVLTVENELVSASVMPDCFALEWAGLSVYPGAFMPTVVMQCEIHYETAGTSLNAGMDRGRCLAAMDAELANAVSRTPQNGLKESYLYATGGGSPALLATNVWWSDPAFGELKVRGNRLARTVIVDVMSYQEAGEL